MKYFKKTNYIIYVPNAKSKINIVQISDLHYSSLISEKQLENFKNKISNLNPDYIAITGDTIDSTESIHIEDKKKVILDFFKSLATVAPTIISLGNHDFYNKRKNKMTFNYPEYFWNQVKDIPGIHLLDNQTYKNKEIEFFGYTQPKKYYWSKTKEKNNVSIMEKDLNTKKDFLKESSVPKIGLIHSPTCITNNKIINLLQNFDIILSGHMHNGCVFPILDELWKSNLGIINASKNFFPHNCRGKIVKKGKNKAVNIIISGALTTFSKCSPKFLHPLNIIFPYHINNIIITNNEEEVTKKITYKYYK